MSRLAWDGTAELVSGDQIHRRERGQRKSVHFPFLADHEQDWLPYPVDPYSAISYDYILHVHCIPIIVQLVGVGKERRIDWFMVIPEKGAPDTRTILGLLAVCWWTLGVKRHRHAIADPITRDCPDGG